ncbi:hybrid sensor histidine kinase/response regulator [Oscillatoria salina]|uniref:hybrid sensor histidine kinase/response regulator n=1 Tax=Oscillatoria salina TaxID=331517 RepID=UPI0013B8E4D3|nr:hybrid sensor histidine kinase/response regulator [Oscillatoria salina]MBZ8182496.1 response regulator [Oscillatoria salina IIICB1]NET86982.1 response regulator [Kamptonema sp. SIO1D9]
MLGSLVKILLVEDSLAEARLLQEVLKGAQIKFNLVHVKRLQDALARLQEDYFDVILLDLTLPDSEGLNSLAPLNHQAPSIPVVVLTNTNDDDLAVEAVRQGAQDYLVKRNINLDVLVRSLRYAIERKQVLETLRANNQVLEMRVRERTEELAKAQEINQLKSEFVSMLSHDFRNPLTTILLSTGLLEDSDNQLTNEKKITLFQLIRSASNNMARLLDEVLLLGKADSGKLKFQPNLLDIEQFCCKLVEELKLSINHKELNLVFASQGKFDRGLWDENLLRHILNNLLANAIKYSGEGGTIRFELISSEETVILRIQDWGIGIPTEDQKHLFEPFHRANNVGKIPGTGLGLAIVKMCVEAHQGKITFESDEGVGTTFTVKLPLLQEAA